MPDQEQDIREILAGLAETRNQLGTLVGAVHDLTVAVAKGFAKNGTTIQGDRPHVVGLLVGLGGLMIAFLTPLYISIASMGGDLRLVEQELKRDDDGGLAFVRRLTESETTLRDAEEELGHIRRHYDEIISGIRRERIRAHDFMARRFGILEKTQRDMIGMNARQDGAIDVLMEERRQVEVHIRE